MSVVCDQSGVSTSRVHEERSLNICGTSAGQYHEPILALEAGFVHHYAGQRLALHEFRISNAAAERTLITSYLTCMIILSPYIPKTYPKAVHEFLYSQTIATTIPITIDAAGHKSNADTNDGPIFLLPEPEPELLEVPEGLFVEYAQLTLVLG